MQDGGCCVWVVYAHHMTVRAASFLVKHSSLVDVYRLPGLHLDTYPQIVVVARARPIECGEDVSAEVLKLVDACKHPTACRRSLWSMSRFIASHPRRPSNASTSIPMRSPPT